MQPVSPTLQKAHAAPLLFWRLVVLSAGLALIPTLWPGLDLATARLLAGPDAVLRPVAWFWVEAINLYIPAVFRLLVFAALAGWLVVSATRRAKPWRLPLAFIVLAGALGPGLVVNSGFKEHWHRARPYQVEEFGGPHKFTRATVITDQCNNNCSFVSGHVACGFFLCSLMLIQRRRQIFWAATGVLAGLLIGFARVSDSAHWLSDVLCACPITLLCSWFVWRLLVRAYSPTQAMPVR